MYSYAKDRLRREARFAAKLRGHVMTSFYHDSENTAFSHCKRCGKEVCINTKPAPNQIDIAGEAIAIHCIRSKYD